MKKLKLVSCLLCVVMLGGLLTGCVGFVNKTTVNEDGSGSFVSSVGYTKAGLEMLASMGSSFGEGESDIDISSMTPFVHNGITYYGVQVTESFNSCEDFHKKFVEAMNNEETGTSMEEDFCVMTQKDDGSFVLRFGGEINDTSEDAMMDQASGSMEIDAESQAALEEMLKEMAMVFEFSFPYPVTQTSAEKVDGVVINGNVVTLDLIKISTAFSEMGKSEAWVEIEASKPQSEALDVTVTLNGEGIDCESYGQSAVIIDGRTLVPLRAIFEALDATVAWDNATQTVTSTKDDTTITVAIGSNIMTRNGEQIALDVPAQLINDRTMVPVRAVAEAFGVNVEWDNDTRTVVLTTSVELAAVETLGELEALGYKYQGYVGINSEYAFSYVGQTRGYDVTVDFSEDSKQAMDELDIFDDDYDQKWDAIRCSLKIIDISPRGKEPLSKEALAKYVGQKASCLVDDGFEIAGYFGSGDEYTFYFAKDYQEYIACLDGSANAIMDAKEFGDDSYKTAVLPCVITSIEYSKPY